MLPDLSNILTQLRDLSMLSNSLEGVLLIEVKL